MEIIMDNVEEKRGIGERKMGWFSSDIKRGDGVKDD